ncbi:hypothetical protein C5167_029536 [Papaver somniferum]|uniref:uncharacterized protein LOC113342333 n=1 Tax=Papaver somniferum TaxID=3469 RepID=UPI000E704455|nr:uncharacterized protein LOC113342333 [Papaver somniferum]RZC92610.1 hypothetical protein C5167_029536 [Papaver somniferum]
MELLRHPMRCSRFMMLMTVVGVLSISLQQSQYVVGIRFVVEKEECLSHSMPYEGDMVQVSYVVIKADVPWNSGLEDGVDLISGGTDLRRSARKRKRLQSVKESFTRKRLQSVMKREPF